MAQLIVGYNFKTVRKNSTKLHTTLSQHVFNHLSYNLNRCIAQLSSCSDLNIQQTGLAQKDSPVVALITMALIATRDFHRVSSKRIGEIVNPCIDNLEIKAHTLKGDMCMHFVREIVFEACLYSSLGTH